MQSEDVSPMIPSLELLPSCWPPMPQRCYGRHAAQHAVPKFRASARVDFLQNAGLNS